MSVREGIRPGGRSARVQESVHKAVRELIAEFGRANVTVPMIATKAGVTPSTIYRRWGDLSELLADVALERMRPDGEPADTGSISTDLHTWGEQFFDEMTSEPGKAIVRAVVACAVNDDWQSQCSVYIRQQIEVLLKRAQKRGETAPPADLIMDRFVAPIIYRSLFSGQTMTPEQARALIQLCLDEAGAGAPAGKRAVTP